MKYKIKAYKLMKLRKDGTIGPLFISRRQVIPLHRWLPAKDIPTPGYARRPGWHVTIKKKAPHLSKKGRVWCEVEVMEYTELKRPECQGGVWLLANWMKVIKVLRRKK